MSARDKYRPRFTPQDALRVAQEVFGITGSIQELPSERDRNFYLKTKSGDEYVLKIAASSEARETLEFQNQAMTHLIKKRVKFHSPRIIKALTGEQIAITKDSAGTPHYTRLLTYLPGKVFAEVNPHTKDLLFQFGVFLGSLTHALEDFSHPSTQREFYWDLKNAASTINRYKEHIGDSEKVAIVEYFLKDFETRILPLLPHLRTSVNHNDANDYNVLVVDAFSKEQMRFGLLDFGDMVFTHTIFELAIGIAYAILDKLDPLTTATHVVRGFHSIFPLTESELDVLFSLICSRLAMSVSISAYQKTLEPDNEYLRISEALAWKALQQLRFVHPRFALYAFRQACNLPPCPENERIISWLKNHVNQNNRILNLDFQKEPLVVLDLSVGSPVISNPTELSNPKSLAMIIWDQIGSTGAQIGVGRYKEPRITQSGEPDVKSYFEGVELGTIHLGMDLILKAGTPVLAPFNGKVHSFQNNSGPFCNGPTIILEHKTGNQQDRFYTLYSHLSRTSLKGLAPGQLVKKGDTIAKIGNYPSNGGWPPSLHFQIIIDMFHWEGNFPSYSPPSHQELWQSICPDPNVILRIPTKLFPEAEMTSDEIQAARTQIIGRSLGISYENPLKIVRGFMQYLYDANGRPYLDGRNNVAHVGHSHPKVVGELSRQAAVLNTNTRYLHEYLIKYAQRLCATLPESLRMCFFVNSGSEANELALRLARTHTNQDDVIVIDGAYHGNTGTLVNISPYKFDGPGGKGAPPWVHKVRTPDTYRGEFKANDPKAGKKYAKDVHEIIKRLKKERRGIAAFICEPLMGCAGQIVLPNHYLQEVFRYIHNAGGVNIVDEVQVGFGRVGTHFWGFQTQGVIPDIVTMGKPIGNGHPLAAVVTTPEIVASFDNGMEFFSSTGGNPVSCAVGMAVLDVLEDEKLQENALKVGNYLMKRLQHLQKKHPLIGDIRGSGLFIGIELVSDRVTQAPATKEATYIIERMKDLGILVSTDGPFANVIKIKPPLVFTKENADFLVQVLDRVLSEDYVKIT